MDIPISLIIPLYNREGLILETLRSVKNQTFENFEVIIIDDQSTDNSFEIVQNYIKDDGRFLIVRRKDSKKGASICRNIGINLAQGKYIMFLDSDDLLDPSCFSSRILNIRKNSNKDFYIFQVALFDDRTKMVDYLCSDLFVDDDLEGFLRATGGWSVSSSIFLSNFLKKNLKFNENALSWQDVDFHLRALLLSNNYLKFPLLQPDVYVRISQKPRISNSLWNFEKIYSRIITLASIEKQLTENQNKRFSSDIFKYYFYYLEIASKKFDKSELQYIIKLWRDTKNFEIVVHSEIVQRYLEFHNFLNRNGLKTISFVIYKLRKVAFGKFFNISKKKRKIKTPYHLSTKLRNNHFF